MSCLRLSRLARLVLVAMFLLTALYAVPLASAQEPALSVDLKSYTIRDVSNTDVTGELLLAGDTYTVYFDVEVSTELPDTRLALSTSLEKAEDVYWSLENEDEYTGVDTGSWQPGQSSIEFNAAKGVANFVLTGTVPINYTTEVLANGDSEVTLHRVKTIPMVTLSLGTEGELLDQRTSEVVDQNILAYRQILTEKKSLLQGASADPTYSDLAQDILDIAETQGDQGFVATARALLNTLPGSPSEFPGVQEYEQAKSAKLNVLQSTETQPEYEQLVSEMIALADDLNAAGYSNNAIDVLEALPGSALEYPEPIAGDSSFIYIIVIVIVVILLIAVLALLLRARSNVSFVKQQVDEEIGRLDVLLVRIGRVDKQLARDVEQVKEQLERLSGR